jgi:hypothetical protein
MVVRRLATLMAICERCEERSLLRINRQIKWLVLLIPLFRVATWYYTDCAHCGKKYPLRKETAKELAVRARQKGARRSTR